MAGAGYLPVARFAKPHGLKGEAILFVLTETAEEHLVAGATLTPVDDGGHPTGAPVVLERARRYHRRWLVKLQGVDDRTAVEPWRGVVLAVPMEAVGDDPDGPLRDFEVPGAAVLVDGEEVGTAQHLLDTPGGPILVVDRQGRELLVPYRPPILVGTDRAARRIEIDPPPGLLEL